MSLTQCLDQQAIQYKQHVNIITKTQTILDHQYKLQNRGTIPKKHRPLPPTIIGTDGSKEKFEEDFNHKYKVFFFQSIQEAITQNTITLELEKARCSDILNQTERELCQATVPTPLLENLFRKFLHQLNLPNHQMSPELKVKLQREKHQEPPQPETASVSKKQKILPLTSSNSKRMPANTKRKRKTTQHPTATKQMKIDCFLEKGPKPPPNPT